jgi:hypothetical protein
MHWRADDRGDRPVEVDVAINATSWAADHGSMRVERGSACRARKSSCPAKPAGPQRLD